VRRFLIVFGVLLLLVGLLWPWITKLGLGRLPGDLHYQKDGFHFYFPLTTCLVISVVLSLIFWLLRK
jgi:hypothetical protein